MSRREPKDGTYFYAESGIRRPSGLPRLLRAEVREGIPHDTVWRVDTDGWVETATLFQYRLNLEENDVQPITDRLAQEIQEKERLWWESRDPQRGTSVARDEDR
jgi:hypothetical protein